MKNKKGFTLIELLAVIVILAIVTVLGATTVLPYLSNAGKNAFAIEANNVIDATSQAISLYQIGSLNSNYVTIDTNEDYDYCFTINNLVDAGLWTKDASALSSTNYRGVVWVKQSANSKAYTYTIHIANDKYYVSNHTGNVSSNDVNDGTITNLVTSCTS